MRKLILKSLTLVFFLRTQVPDAWAISLETFRNEVFRPENLPGTELGDVSAETKVNDVLNFLINLILYASGSVAVLMLVYGALMLVGSTGNQERKDKAVKIIKFALVGLFVVILAFAAVTNVVDLIFRATT